MADSIQKLLRARERARKADASASAARRDLRRLMREEIDAGRITQTAIAEAFEVSRQRIRQMLNEVDAQ